MDEANVRISPETTWVQSTYRTLASAWLLATLAGIALILKDLTFAQTLFVAGIALAGTFGVVLLWKIEIHLPAAIARSVPSGAPVRARGNRMLEGAGTHIVSEHEGRVTRLLLTVPKAYGGPASVDAREARHFETLIGRMGTQVNYLVVAAPRQRETVEGWLRAAGIDHSRLTFVESPRFEFSIWAQDAYVALRDPAGNSILWEGIAIPRGEDMTVAYDIAAQTDVAAVPSHLYFQGGNVLGGDRLTLMGLDYLVKNTTRYGLPTLADVVQQFEAIFGTRIVPLGEEIADAEDWYQRGILSGYGYQPIFHIDMYVTPTGVVGPSGKEIVFLGRPRKAREITGKWSDVAELDNERYDRYFDATAGQLEAEFEVRTLPLWITYGNLNRPASRAERFYNLTWNNAIVENDGNDRRVLLPMYSQDASEFAVDASLRRELEAAAAAEWKALQFDVRFTDGLEDLAHSMGSLHCIAKTLQRARR